MKKIEEIQGEEHRESILTPTSSIAKEVHKGMQRPRFLI